MHKLIFENKTLIGGSSMKKFVVTALSVAVLGLGAVSIAGEKVAAKGAKPIIIKMENTLEEGFWDLACWKLIKEKRTNKILIIDKEYEVIVTCKKQK